MRAKILCLFFSFFIAHNIYSQGDDCSTALNLPNVTNFCSNPAQYTSVGATASGFAIASCWTPAGATQDVWFQFTAIGTDVLISASGSGFGGTMVRPRIAIYSGSCLTTINELACSNFNAGANLTQLYKAGLVPGTTYYIRISTTAAQAGTFDLCVNNYTPSFNAGADCNGAALLCNTNPVSVGTLSGAGANADEPETSSCMSDPLGSDENNSSWYYFTCGTSGTLVFDIVPVNPNDDIDFLFYQLATTNVCGVRTVLRCDAASCHNAQGSTGLSMTDPDLSEQPGCTIFDNAYCQFVNLTAGTTYAILVNNWSGNTGYTINWGGTATFQGPDPNITSTATTICTGGTVTYDGTTSTNYTSLNWNFNAGASPSTATGTGPHVVTYPTAGNYVTILNATNASGCSTTETVNVTVNPGPAAPTATSPVNYCQNAAASALSATGSNLLWYTVPAGGSGSSTAPTPSTAATGTTSYYVSQTTTCEGPRTQVDVVVNPLPNASAVSPANLQCNPSTVQLSSSSTTPGATYNWAGPGVVSGGTTTTPTVGTAGTYTLTVADPASTCTSTATVIVNPAPVPPTASAGSSQALDCLSTPVTLDGSASTAGMNYAWTGPAAGNPAGTTPTAINTNVTVAGTYTLTVTDGSNGCSSTSTVIVNPAPGAPLANAGSTQTLACIPATVTLDGTASTGGLTYSWEGPTAGTPAGTTPAQMTTDVTTAGTYTLTVTDGGTGCSSTSTVIVNPTPPAPTANAGSTTTLNCVPSTVTLDGSASTAGMSYSWEGPAAGNPAGTTPAAVTTDVNAAGTYTLTVTDASSGCSSTSTVVVNPTPPAPTANAGSASTLNCVPSTVTLDGSASTTGMNYAWTGPTAGTPAGTTPIQITTDVSTAGTYTLTVVDGTTGCSSTSTVVVNPVPPTPTANAGSAQTLTCATTTVTLDGSASTAAMNYAWTGPAAGTPAGTTPTQITTDVSAAGTYTLTVVDGATGCSSTSTVIVNPAPGAPTASAGTAQTLGCVPNSVTLNGNGSASGMGYAWTGPTAGTPAGTTPSAITTDVTNAGTYTLTVTDAGTGCSSTSTVVVNPVPAPPTSNAGTNQTLTCGTTTVTLNGSGSTAGVSYSWEGPSAGTPAGTAPTAASTNVTATGTYTLTVTAGNGCTGTSQVIVNSNTTAPLANAGNPQTLTCSATTVTINGSLSATGMSYSWTGPAAGTPAGSTPTAVTTNVTAAGTYTITVTDASNGCSSTSTVAVGSNTTPPVANAGASQTLTCSTTSVTLNGGGSSAGMNYGWVGPTAGTPAGSTPTAITTNVTTAGTYTLGVIDPSNGCVSSSLVQVINNAIPPVVNAGPAGLIPCSAVSSITLNPGSQNAAYTYSWAGPGGFASGQFNPGPVSAAGTYTLTALNPANGCSQTSTVVVVQNPDPVAGINASPTSGTLPLPVTLISTSTNAPGLSWSFGDGSFASNVDSTANVYQQAGTYQVILIASNGTTACNDTAYATITVLEQSNLIIPNVFSPNGDNINDLFKATAISMKELTIDVFNRWGNKITSFDGINGSWDGKDHSEGTYYYMAKGESLDGAKVEQKGTVMLFK